MCTDIYFCFFFFCPPAVVLGSFGVQQEFKGRANKYIFTEPGGHRELEGPKKSLVQTHKLDSTLNKNWAFNLIFYLSFEFESHGMGDRKCELWRRFVARVCVCVCAVLSLPGDMVIKNEVLQHGVATNWVYKFAAGTCPTIKQTSCQEGPASVVPFFSCVSGFRVRDAAPLIYTSLPIGIPKKAAPHFPASADPF